MRNVIKTLGILIIVVAVLFLAACPGIEPEPVDPVVTFDANGGTFGSSSTTTRSVPKDSTVTAPGNPTRTTMTSTGAATLPAGFYKGNSNTFTFGKWQLDGQDYDFNTPVTGNITLKATWTGGPTAVPETSLTSGNDVVSKAVNFINSDTITSSTEYTLVLGDNVTGVGQQLLTKQYANLTIIPERGDKTITSSVNGTTNATSDTDNGGVFFVVGNTSKHTTNNPSLTLVNIALKGHAEGSKNALVRVQYGATLNMNDGANISGYKNLSTRVQANANDPVTGAGDGRGGNGAAVHVTQEGILNMNGSAAIEKNKALGAHTANLLVGGVYAINKAVINMNGGTITQNGVYKTVDGAETIDDNHTKDVYATEDVEFNLKGGMRLGEVTINASGANATNDTGWTYTTITVSSLEYKIESLNLRASLSGAGSITVQNIQDRWTGGQILKASAGSTLSAADVAKFPLGNFRGPSINQAIGTGYIIGISGNDLGKLVKVTQ
jgi:hypothetical protein